MSDVEGDAAVQDVVLDDLESAVNYRRWLCELAEPYLGDDAIEIGSGLGSYVAAWVRAGRRVTASEGDARRVEALRERLGGVAAVKHLKVPLRESGSHSAVVALNVLEHIPDDVDALRSMARLVRPGGTIILLVPAFEWALSRFDREIGHQRRYTTDSLRERLGQAGLVPRRVQYVNWAGLIAWMVLMKWLGGRPREGLGLRFWDGVVIPIVRWTERFGPPPFGQSVFAVASRPT